MEHWLVSAKLCRTEGGMYAGSFHFLLRQVPLQGIQNKMLHNVAQID